MRFCLLAEKTTNKTTPTRQIWITDLTLLLSSKDSSRQISPFMAELYSSGAPCSYRKEKETHKWIFSWISWIAVLLVGACARRRGLKSRNKTAILQLIGWLRHAALVYSVNLWYWTCMLWLIGICQNKVSADQYHLTILRAQVLSSLRPGVFFSWPLPKAKQKAI